MNERIRRIVGVIKKESGVGVGFAAEHFKLAVFIVTLGAVYLAMGDHFAELVYGLLRLAAVMLAAFVIICLVFKHTVWPYIAAGNFLKDFEALDATRKVWATLGVIALVVWVAMECFVHA